MHTFVCVCVSICVSLEARSQPWVFLRHHPLCFV